MAKVSATICNECKGKGSTFIDRLVKKTSAPELRRVWGSPGIARLGIECFACGGWGDLDPDPTRLAVSVDSERPRR